ncbi:MAG: hypothetical protein ACTSY1_03495 [Alphaproteobacteria bacterium]
MKISMQIEGIDQVGRRLADLGELPGLNEALLRVAEAVRAEATANLAAWPGAAGVQVETTVTSRAVEIGTSSGAAWHAEFGQRGRAANQWLSRAFADQLAAAKSALRRAVKAAVSRQRGAP